MPSKRPDDRILAAARIQLWREHERARRKCGVHRALYEFARDDADAPDLVHERLNAWQSACLVRDRIRRAINRLEELEHELAGGAELSTTRANLTSAERSDYRPSNGLFSPYWPSEAQESLDEVDE